MTNLNPRQQKVLWATVNHYIATAEPVGSKVIAEGYKFNISPATIRNIMGVLEKSGLLYQPHTSAGRVPSDSGYRVYVDHLIHLDKAAHTIPILEQKLEQKFDAIAYQNLEHLLRSTAQILATFSGCIAMITSPNLQTARIRHVQLLMVDHQTLILILVTDTYNTTSVTVKLPPDMEVSSLESEIQILTNFLNTHLRDQLITDLTKLRWQELDQEFQQYAQVLTTSLKELAAICNPPEINQIFISGLTELLRQPEFSQLNQVQAIIQLLEVDQASLFPLIFNNASNNPANALTIRIGNEISLEPIQNCTLISSTYSYDDVPVGSVGVLGPTRMDYERAIASVQVIAHNLSEAMNQRL
ncbi:heat-inducible transcription repressor HrcA [Synechococcus sp. PCC 7502]|uniref:heat-inducible transcriptional repressor HrcA n=1 Tax=Synechococcus sp. PCC 7502 TaxID=1173263 RepID=UPI00029FB464|nr:heat-inducible transcriptional repressor HrcA [Synechococcus sp. PCC 7502]AFY72571.1 heat-inducible transcription repressor HrcA [Synechococcus sp. PCC 7502]